MGRSFPRAAHFYRASSRIIAAPFSAIIMVGALVLPEVIVGITEASIDAQPLDARDAQPAVDHRHRVAGEAHFGGADRMKDRGADIAGGLYQSRLVVVAHRGTRQIFVGMITAPAPAAPRCAASAGSHRRRRGGLRRSKDNWAGSPARRRRSARAQPHEPRLVGCRLQTLAVKAGNLCSGSPKRSSDSGCTWNCRLARSWSRIGAGEQAELRRRHGQGSAPEQRIFGQHAARAERRMVALVERLDAVDLVDQPQLQMILQIGADAGPVEHDGDAVLAQMFGRSDAGQQQDLGRSDRAGGRG